MKEKNKSQTLSAHILLAHGSKDPRWRKPFEMILDNCKISSPKKKFCLCYLELCKPSLIDTVQELKKNNPNISSIIIHPIFLSAGIHVNKDILSIVSDLKGIHPEIKFKLKVVVGENILVKDAIHKVITS